MVDIIAEHKTEIVTIFREKIHMAVCQIGSDFSERFKNFKLDCELIIHKFSTTEQLYKQNQRSYIDLVLIAAKSESDALHKIVTSIKLHSTLQFIPVMAYVKDADRDLLIRMLKEGIDDVTAGDWDDALLSAKASVLINRSKRDLSVNPSTKLPGAIAIEYEVDRRIKANELFAVCYADLDNFKAYNDHYGYFYGDKMIKLTGHIIRSVVQDLDAEGFVGHIGGDDFVFVIKPDRVDKVCQNIISTFDRLAPYRYADEDRERGFIEVPNRKGEVEKFPIFTLSIAVLINQKRMFNHPGEMSHMMADLKKYTKTLPGSNYMIERRKKY